VNIASVNLNLLLAFEALLEERNVSAAAARIGLTQPAMSNALARLRALFGDELFVRTARGMWPTPRALALAESVHSGLAHIRAAFDVPKPFDPGATTRTFRISMTDYAEMRVLGPLLLLLQSSAPHLQILVHRAERIFLPPEDALHQGALDAAIGFFPEATQLAAGTQSLDLFNENNVVIGRRGHPLLKRTLSLHQFTSAKHIANITRPDSRGFIDDILAGHGRRRRLQCATPHLLTIPYLVSESDAIAVVPEGLAMRFKKCLALQVCKVPFRMPLFRMRLLWHQHAGSDPAHQWLRSQILSCFPQVS
jgi:DNA-binding transcriptional LysR family regulator